MVNELTNPDLEIKINDWVIPNPILVSPGTIGFTNSLIKRALRSGVGGVFTDPISQSKNEEIGNPTTVAITGGFITTRQKNSLEITELKDEIINLNDDLKRVIVSIDSEQKLNQIKKIISSFENLPIGGFNIIFNREKQDKEKHEENIEKKRSLFKELRNITKKTIIVSFQYDEREIKKIGKICEETGINAIVINITPDGMLIDIENRIPILSSKNGKIIGNSVKPIGVNTIYFLYKEVNIPLIVCGGIMTGEDAIEYILAGATGVQIDAGLSNGFSIFVEIENSIFKYLKNHNLNSLTKIIGGAHG